MDLAAITLAATILISDKENKNPFNIPVPVCISEPMISKLSGAYELPIDYKKDLFVVSYDTNCDGKKELRVIIRKNSYAPLIYLVNRDQDAETDEYYYDLKENGITGDEKICTGLEDCMDRVFNVSKNSINA